MFSFSSPRWPLHLLGPAHRCAVYSDVFFKMYIAKQFRVFLLLCSLPLWCGHGLPAGRQWPPGSLHHHLRVQEGQSILTILPRFSLAAPAMARSCPAVCNNITGKCVLCKLALLWNMAVSAAVFASYACMLVPMYYDCARLQCAVVCSA